MFETRGFGVTVCTPPKRRATVEGSGQRSLAPIFPCTQPWTAPLVCPVSHSSSAVWVQGGWLVRNAVGQRACLVGEALHITYHHGPTYLEVSRRLANTRLHDAFSSCSKDSSEGDYGTIQESCAFNGFSWIPLYSKQPEPQ